MHFVWFADNAAAHEAKHGVSFEEAATAFDDVNARVELDESSDRRIVLIGMSTHARILFVVFAEIHEDIIRIIAARKASPTQRRRYGKTR